MAVKKTHREELGGGLVIEQNSHSVYLGYVPNDYDEELIVAGENCHFDERIVQSVFCDFEYETDLETLDVSHNSLGITGLNMIFYQFSY